jgi:hypothetical protein
MYRQWLNVTNIGPRLAHSSSRNETLLQALYRCGRLERSSAYRPGGRSVVSSAVSDAGQVLLNALMQKVLERSALALVSTLL